MRRIAVVAIILVLILAAIGYWRFRNWPEEHRVDQFLTAIEHKEYDKAFAIWTNDPDWKQHPQKFVNYTRGQFELDWGPSGDFGAIREHKILGGVRTPEDTGVVVAVRINDRAEPVPIIVNRKTKELGFSPVGVRINTF